MALFVSGKPGGGVLKPVIPSNLSAFWNYSPFTPQFQNWVSQTNWTQQQALARETQTFINSLASIQPGPAPFAKDFSYAAPWELRRPVDAAREWEVNYSNLWGGAPTRARWGKDTKGESFWLTPFGNAFNTSAEGVDISEAIYFPQYLLMQGKAPGALIGPTDIRHSGGDDWAQVDPSKVAELPEATENQASFLIRGGHTSKARRVGLIPA